MGMVEVETRFKGDFGGADITRYTKDIDHQEITLMNGNSLRESCWIR
jgi:hypothetical protein